MRIVIITQNEPFYLAENLEYLLSILPQHSTVVGCVVSDVSPFGKKESFFKKAKKTLNIFGIGFFLHYSVKYISSKISSKKNLLKLLDRYDIPRITLNKPINDKVSVDMIKSYEPDLLISILGNQIFKSPIIDLAPKGCLNLHTALLPQYRGLMPTFWVLKNNEEYTGVSVFFVDEGIDSGPIIVQKRIKINNRSQEELIKDTKRLGMEAIAEAVDKIHDGNYRLLENDNSIMTYFSFPTRNDVINFRKNRKKFF